MPRPQTSVTSDAAKEAALHSTLSSLRNAIDRFRVVHGRPPGPWAGQAPSCSGESRSPSVPGETIVFQLTFYTNAAGQNCSSSDGGNFPHGPFLKGFAAFPANPVTGSAVLVPVGAGDLKLSADGPGGGWKYDYVSGEIIASDTRLDSQGRPFDTY